MGALWVHPSREDRVAFKITIEVEGGKQTATITDDAGNEKIVNGLALFGYDQQHNQLYNFAWGSPADAAVAVGEGLAQAYSRGDTFYLDFYKCLLAQMCIRTGVNPNEEKKKVLTADDIIEMEVGTDDDPKKWN